MAKRTATSDLNKDNWDDEEVPERMGMFHKASVNELKTRVMKRGRRTINAGATGPSVFQNFNAFGSSTLENSSPTPSFSFASSKPLSGSSPPKAFPVPAFTFGKQEETKVDKSESLNSSSETEKSSMFQYMPNSNQAKPKKALAESETQNEKSPSFSFTSSKVVSPLVNSKCDEKISNSVTINSPESVSHKSNQRLPPSSLFSFGSDKQTDETIGSVKNHDSRNGSHSDEFLSGLKSLNESFLGWVQTHLDKNKFVNLNPIFKDYKRHYDKLKESKGSSSSLSKEMKMNEEEKKSPFSDKTSSAGLFSFGSKPDDKNKGFGFSSKETTDTKSSGFGFSSKENANTKTSGFGFSSKENPDTKSSGFSFSSKEKIDTKSSGFDFSSKETADTNSTGFTFSNGSTSSNFSAPPTTIFSFATKTDGNSSPKFSNISSENDKSSTKRGQEEQSSSDEPPKVEVVEVKEDDAVYEKKVKLFYKKDGGYVDKGVGTLFLKPAGNDKMQLIVRALTNLGNILLNIILNESIPTQRVGKNNVLLVCVPNPPIDPSNASVPVSMLIRVKTAEDADQLLAKIDEYKKN